MEVLKLEQVLVAILEILVNRIDNVWYIEYVDMTKFSHKPLRDFIPVSLVCRLSLVDTQRRHFLMYLWVGWLKRDLMIPLLISSLNRK